MKTALRSGLAVLAFGLFTGCAMFNSLEVEYAPHTTFGQEMMDLKQAHENGALSDEEYETLKKQVMSFVDKIDGDPD